MAWSDAARAAALAVRRAHARAVIKFDAQWKTGGDARHAIYKMATRSTDYQHSSALRHARAGQYPKPVALRLAKEAAAAHVLRKHTGKRATYSGAPNMYGYKG